MFKKTPSWLPLPALLALVYLAPAEPLRAATTKSFDFALETWFDVEHTEGAVTVHRARLTRKSGGFSVKSPANEPNLQAVEVQIEYSNETDRKWKGWYTIRWLDENGTLIDGFQDKGGFTAKSARRLVNTSVTTLKYGLDRAKKLEIEIFLEP
jgi:hypothetical protein